MNKFLSPAINCAAWMAAIATIGIGSAMRVCGQSLETLKFNHPGLVVDLKVGLWAYPIPCDFDGDGDFDLLVCCPDKPQSGVYFFENVQGDEPRPVFKPPVKVAASFPDLTPSYSAGKLRLLSRNTEVLDPKPGGFGERRKIYPTANIHTPISKLTVRANQWSIVDYDGDGADDLIVGIDDWEEYGMNFGGDGWAHAYDPQGQWKLGPLRGYVYVIRNEGTNERPSYGEPRRLEAVDASGSLAPIDVYGRPSPCLADFDGDGDLDLICGEFLDGFTYFENIGSRTKPKFAAGRRLQRDGQDLTMDLEMIVPVAFDWDRDGHVDLIVGDEDGRVAWVRNTGVLDGSGVPLFEPPYYFQQEADDVCFGALVTPFAVDWDGDGDTDLICGNSAGYIGWIENLDGGNPPRWAAPVKIEADLIPIRIQAGPNGSCQGPSEPKWGYTTLSVADWDHDGLPDLIVNSIWGKVVWYQNIGTRSQPRMTAARPIEVEWPGSTPKPPAYWWTPQGRELATQWRTTPMVIDWDSDGLNDLVMLDHEGYLAWFRRVRTDAGLRLMPGQRIFEASGPSVFDSRHAVVSESPGTLQLNHGIAGRGGRVKFTLFDWDGDGNRDLLVNSTSIHWMRGRPVAGDDALGQRYEFVEQGPLSDHILAGHTTSPTIARWADDAPIELLIGAEDGRIYRLPQTIRHGQAGADVP